MQLEEEKLVARQELQTQIAGLERYTYITYIVCACMLTHIHMYVSV